MEEFECQECGAEVAEDQVVTGSLDDDVDACYCSITCRDAHEQGLIDQVMDMDLDRFKEERQA